MPDEARPAPSLDLADAAGRLAEIERLRRGHTDRADERKILDLLGGAGPAELDHIVQRLPLGGLLSDVDDRVFGPDHRAELVKLLSEDRLADLSIAARASMIRGVQHGRTCSADERLIRNVILGTRGQALTDLKNAVDAADDHRDLQQLIFRDIDDAALRREILDHLGAAAAPRDDLKVLSDIDDTLYCNWLDRRYPKGTIYPGVRALYAALDLAPRAEGPLGDLTFLTARPGDRAGYSEGLTRKNLTERGLGHARVLTGDFGHLLTNELIAEKKYAGFAEYRLLFPEYAFVFLGDSGQGDAIAGGRMMEHPSGGMRAVFIHDVVAGGTSPEARAEWQSRGVWFHDTYVGAALNACRLGLLELQAAARVAGEALAELAAIPFADAGQREDRLADHRRDVARLNALLPEAERVPLPM